MLSRSPPSSPGSATAQSTDPARPDTGEPLGGARWESDWDLCRGKYDCGAVDLGSRWEEGDEQEQEFEAAADRLRELVQSASRDQLLYLYARYKQVKVGRCDTLQPGFLDFEGQRKWQAWKQLGDMSARQAMREYVSCIDALDPEGGIREEERQGTGKISGFGGPVVSRLYREETIREEDKNIFDYCRENDVGRVGEVISSREVDVDARDEEGRALLHWACDRGHEELVSLLLRHNADVNGQDGEGQTALHYASACEFEDIVGLLLDVGADPSIRDLEGSLPEEVTESSAITSMLRRNTAPTG